MILALDLATKNSGYAVYDDNKLIESGVLKSSSTDVIKRIYKITNLVNDIINKYENKITKVYAEEVMPRSEKDHINSAHIQKVLLWLQASICFMLHDDHSNLEIEFLYPSEWRKLCGIHTGAGIKRTPLKALAIQFVKEKFNKDVSDDEADAICLGYAALHQENEMFIW